MNALCSAGASGDWLDSAAIRSSGFRPTDDSIEELVSPDIVNIGPAGLAPTLAEPMGPPLWSCSPAACWRPSATNSSDWKATTNNNRLSDDATRRLIEWGRMLSYVLKVLTLVE